MDAGLSPELAAAIPRFIQIESGGDPNARTGSYTGLLQMGPDERARYGGDSLQSGLAMLKNGAYQLEQHLGRPPTPAELYFAHQQGMGGFVAQNANPGAPAWQNMASTAEGRQKGDAWAKEAIWKNIPNDLKGQFGNVDNVTGQQFMDLWANKVNGTRVATPNPNGPLGANRIAQAQPQTSLGFLLNAAGVPGFSGQPSDPNAAPQQDDGGASARAQLAQLLSSIQPQQLTMAPKYQPRFPLIRKA